MEREEIPVIEVQISRDVTIDIDGVVGALCSTQIGNPRKVYLKAKANLCDERHARSFAADVEEGGWGTWCHGYVSFVGFINYRLRQKGFLEGIFRAVTDPTDRFGKVLEYIPNQ